MGECTGFGDRTGQAARAEALRRMHAGPEPLVLVNAWDAASARVVEEAGFPAVATSSSAIAASLGFQDGERLSVDEALAAIGRIAGAVRVPVTADIEAGYAERHGDLGEIVCRLIESGAVGLNLEDVAGRSPLRLLEPAEAARRIETVRKTADGEGVPLVLNARTDVLLRAGQDLESALRETAARLARYRDAGADCVFPVGVRDVATIETLTAELSCPLNVLVWAGGPTVAELAALGVRRISTGSGPMRVALGALRSFAEELREAGTYAGLQRAPTNAELQALVGGPRAKPV